MNEFFRGLDPKLVRKLLTLGLAGVVLLVAAAMLSGSNVPASKTASPSPSTASAVSSPPPTGGSDRLLAFQSRLDQTVQQSLQPITGAGVVRVSITLQNSPQLSYEINNTTQQQTTQSKDSHGGTQTTTNISKQSQLANASSGQPVLKSEIGPSIDGVLVVATGAQSEIIRKELTQAVETLLGIPAYKVLVLP